MVFSLFWKSPFLVGTLLHKQRRISLTTRQYVILQVVMTKHWRATWNEFQNAINVWHLTTTSLFFVFAILQVVFPVSSTPSFFGIKEYWVLSLLTECKLQNPKQQKISEMADLLKIMRPKCLSFERKKKVKINLADLIEPNRTQTIRNCLVFIFFVALQNICGRRL